MKKLLFVPLTFALVVPLAICATHLTDRANAQGTATTSETLSPVAVLTRDWYRYLVEPNSITCQWQRKLQVILCQRRHKGWLRIENTEFEFLDVNVEEYTTTNGEDDYKAYNLFLNTDIGRIDVYDYDRDRDRAYADAAQFQTRLVKGGNPFLFFTFDSSAAMLLELYLCSA